ncbi:putative membrane protein (TIGR04086 family) [Hydrogenispora ethanolica]|jgi:putative membrane protein (TIGR04086 family)|uniref:Putative membrane protein (TIGR04086 family) n=1 Tax=Hydrogenispora ethanolica TaxID=1082276 RepID=A0A4R1RB46_HYDET|nr:TIGR04086 family membrane protein [Hydrogenispora ethanolica]TCL62956.1 putative membrane protein (TIGR04086 family) [Hydrogenispora ethanolica]
MADQEKSSFPFRPILRGTLVFFAVVVILTVLLSILTELGWTITAFMPNDYYLFIIYIGIISGAVYAGKNAREDGWLIGISVGALSSLLLFLMVIFILRERFQIGVFVVKSLINAFIGAFGGIIGVNLAGKA